MIRNKRTRAVIIAGCALAVVAVVGVGVAFASPSGRPRYVTASVGTGDVTQTYTTSGAVTRTNTSTASFAVAGTVSSVRVSVGNSVDAGEVLAMVKKGPLQLAVLQAETSVAEARASLYSAQHPSSGASVSRTGSSAQAASTANGSGASGSGAAKASAGVTIDPAVLLKVTQRLTTAVASESTVCAPVFGATPPVTPSPSRTPSARPTPSASPSKEPSASANPSVAPSASVSPTIKPSASASPTIKPSASASPTIEPSASASRTTEPSATTSATPSESPSATPSESPTRPSGQVRNQADVIERNNPTTAQLKACGTARAEVQLATTALQRTVRQLTTPRPGSSNRSAGNGGSSSGSGDASNTPKVSAAQVASAKAKLLQAEQDLQKAQDDLDHAELVAPISGTIGSVDLRPGGAAGSESITIVGSGNAQLQIELPLKTRALIATGRQVSVAAAGSTTTLHGTVTAIGVTETSGTAGDAPTYASTVTVADPNQVLATGARASVSIPVRTATNVVRVPVSAVTPTGSGTGTVQVVESAQADNAHTVEVSTGAVGAGWVEITQGLNAGELVALADNTAALPTNSNGRRTTTPASPSVSASAQPGARSSTGTGTSGATQPSVSPTR